MLKAGNGGILRIQVNFLHIKVGFALKPVLATRSGSILRIPVEIQRIKVGVARIPFSKLGTV